MLKRQEPRFDCALTSRLWSGFEIGSRLSGVCDDEVTTHTAASLPLCGSPNGVAAQLKSPSCLSTSCVFSTIKPPPSKLTPPDRCLCSWLRCFNGAPEEDQRGENRWLRAARVPPPLPVVGKNQMADMSVWVRGYWISHCRQDADLIPLLCLLMIFRLWPLSQNCNRLEAVRPTTPAPLNLKTEKQTAGQI